MKPKRFVPKASADLHYFSFPALFEDPVTAHCLKCSADLTLHQPDMETPERLLGVCESCKYWFLIDLVPDVSQGIMITLPDREVIREVSHLDPVDGISILEYDTKSAESPPPGPINESESSP